MFLADPGDLLLVAGDIFQAQNRAPAGGPAFAFDHAAERRLQDDAERAAVDEKFFERRLECLRGACLEPLAEAQYFGVMLRQTWNAGQRVRYDTDRLTLFPENEHLRFGANDGVGGGKIAPQLKAFSFCVAGLALRDAVHVPDDERGDEPRSGDERDQRHVPDVQLARFDGVAGHETCEHRRDAGHRRKQQQRELPARRHSRALRRYGAHQVRCNLRGRCRTDAHARQLGFRAKPRESLTKYGMPSPVSPARRPS